MNKFTPWQLMRLWAVFLIATPLVFLFNPIYNMAGYQGWQALVIAFLMSLLFAFFGIRLSGSLRHRDWGQYGASIVGKWPHHFFMFLLAAYCVLMTALCISGFADIFGTTYLPGTPDWVIVGSFLVAITLTARSGLRTIVYMADGLFLFIYLTPPISLPFVQGKTDYEMTRALITHWDLAVLLKTAAYATPWLGEIALVFLILHHFRQEGKSMRSMAIASAAACAMILLYWVIILLLFGPQLASQMRFPILELVRFIELGEVLENLDPLLISVWASTLFIKSNLYMYLALRLIGRLIHYENWKSLSFLLAGLAFVFSEQFLNRPAEFEAFIRSPLLIGPAAFVQLIPLYYWVVASIRKKTRQPQAEQDRPSQV